MQVRQRPLLTIQSFDDRFQRGPVLEVYGLLACGMTEAPAEGYQEDRDGRPVDAPSRRWRALLLHDDNT